MPLRLGEAFLEKETYLETKRKRVLKFLLINVREKSGLFIQENFFTMVKRWQSFNQTNYTEACPSFNQTNYTDACLHINTQF